MAEKDDSERKEAPMDFIMPDFSAIGRTIRLMSWIPAIFAFATVSTITFLVLVVYNGLAQGGYNMTYGGFMLMVLASFAVGAIAGGIAKITASRKIRKSPFSF